jgi:hypothetical protein
MEERKKDDKRKEKKPVPEVETPEPPQVMDTSKPPEMNRQGAGNARNRPDEEQKQNDANK